MKRVKRKKVVFVKIISLIILISLVGATPYAYKLYKWVYSSNVSITDDDTFLYIPSNSSYEDIIDILDARSIIKDRTSFEWVAEKMNYKSHVHSGRYSITPNMSNRALVMMLRAGKQTPVKLIFNNIITKPQLAGVVSNTLEADSLVIIKMLNDKVFLRKYHLTIDNVMGIFIPNTYEFFWNTDAMEFFEKMMNEYEGFWNDQRIKKARALALEPMEVTILASIVQKETIFDDEKSTVAGVYLNRIKNGWKLQADPTLIFALGDFSIRRVLKVHKELDSPYNTYMYRGLPPGPICLPSIKSIDAVLSPKEHDYMYFCAKDDFSGYHNFAVTHNEHILNAKKYRAALNRKKIYR